MKTAILILLINCAAASAQQLSYTLWADGLVNPQLAKSSLYFLGAGTRIEVKKPLNSQTHNLFAQAGYAYFFQKNTSAFTANIGLVNLGYRYQSRKAFNASASLGAQYWTERMGLRLADNHIAETFRNVMPSVTIGIGFRINPRYQLSLENRALFKPEPASLTLRNNLALSFGYTL